MSEGRKGRKDIGWGDLTCILKPNESKSAASFNPIPAHLTSASLPLTSRYLSHHSR